MKTKIFSHTNFVFYNVIVLVLFPTPSLTSFLENVLFENVVFFFLNNNLNILYDYSVSGWIEAIVCFI